MDKPASDAWAIALRASSPVSRPCEESRYFRHAHGSSQRVRKRHVHGCATPADAVAPTIDIVTELIEVNSLTEHDRAQRCALGADQLLSRTRRRTVYYRVSHSDKGIDADSGIGDQRPEHLDISRAARTQLGWCSTTRFRRQQHNRKSYTAESPG